MSQPESQAVFEKRHELGSTFAVFQWKSWSNHGPRSRADHYLIRFWEPPASRIFNQLPVDRVLSLRYHGVYPTREAGVFDRVRE
jgi:hypothetical protein